MKYDFIVLGATGQQGRISSIDLLKNGYSVLLCGRNKERVEHILNNFKKTDFVYLDLRNYKDIVKTIKQSGARILLNCAEGDWNLQVLKACVETKINSIDLGSEIWMTKKQLEMDNLLKKVGIVHITGCGSVPGIGNVMLNHVSNEFDTIKTIEVGFSWNSNIKEFVIPFSMESITEEFTEPATNVKNGRFIKIRPMDSLEENKNKLVGKEERFYVRHPETYTFYKYYKHKGIENVKFYAGFPIHSFKMIDAIIKLGLGSKKEIDFEGMKIRPIDFTTKVLKRLPMPKGYKEKEDLWVKIYGKKNKKSKKILMQCVVNTLDNWEFAGCNIDTGMPASIIAQMIFRGEIQGKGSFAPEAIVPTKLFFKELSKRKMFVYQNGRKIN